MIKFSQTHFEEQYMNNTHESSDTAVSIFGQAQGTNDFPVLKAFQEYIDAE